MDHPFTEQSPSQKPRRRDYEKVLELLEKRWRRRPSNRARMMQDIVNSLWDVFGEKTFSWCGFYCPGPNKQELLLGPHCRESACSSISADGVCGKAMKDKVSQVVADAKTLGGADAQCHPETRSEIAIPVVDIQGNVFAVLDVDSKELGSFNDEDRRWLERILKELSQSPSPEVRN